MESRKDIYRALAPAHLAAARRCKGRLYGTGKFISFSRFEWQQFVLNDAPSKLSCGGFELIERLQCCGKTVRYVCFYGIRNGLVQGQSELVFEEDEVDEIIGQLHRLIV
jgi:hypothetical protein